MRPPAPLPDGIQIRYEESAFASALDPAAAPPVVITRRWLRSKHFVLLLVFWSLAAVVGWLIHEHGLNVATGIAAFLVVSWNYILLTMFVNRTRITAGRGEVNVTHGPLPSITSRKMRFRVEQLKQLYAAQLGPRYIVKADLHDGRSVALVSPLLSADQALFVEQQLERALGIVDFEVPGELASSLSARVAGASGNNSGAKAALGAVFLMPLVLGGGITALVFYLIRTEVSGHLSAQIDNAAFEFVPSDCRSGEPYGFVGVDLTSDAGQAVRIMNDPVRGTLLLLQPTSRQALPVNLSQCSTQDVQIVRTNTTVNEVRVFEGRATLACPDVQASLTFAGCH